MKYYVPSTAIRPHRPRPSWPRTVLVPAPVSGTPAPLARLHEGVDLGTRGHVVWSREGTRHGCLSVQVLQEFFVTTTWKLPRPLEAPAAAQIVDDLAHWHVHSPAVADVRAAIDIHQRTGASFWDAMILRSAQELGCQILYSED